MLVDFHAHIYPNYDVVRAFRCARRNFERSDASSACNALVLAERYDCNFFEIAAAGRYNSAELEISRLANDPNALLAEIDGKRLYVIAGRQIVSKERLELLAFFTDIRIADRQSSFEQIMRAVRDAGGVTVINWAPGKWWGERGRIIASIINDQQYRPLVLCDTTLRPQGYPIPLLQRKAASMGVPSVAGSDPLPLPGEERLIATYATQIDAALDEQKPAIGLKAIILDPRAQLNAVGVRSSIPGLALRLGRFYAMRRA